MTMERVTRALVSGSFDPITAGHADLVERAARMFDEVWVVVCINASKRGRFTPEQRLDMVRAAFRNCDRVRVGLCEGLLADYAKERGITVLVRGARGSVDFDYELSRSLINRSLNPELDTIVLPTRAELQHVSSTMISELIKYGKDYSQYLPEGVAELISEYTKN